MPTASQRTPLDDRSLAILNAIVRLNLETGRPVSSGLVERGLQRAVSSATVRSVMKRLEDAGYLEQPHTSAGRLPTDAGYRVFVDRLLAGWSLRRHEAPAGMEDQMRQGVRRAAGSQDRVKLLAGLLSRLTDSLSIVAGPTLADATVQRVECYRRGGGRVLMVVILDNEAVRTGLVTLPDDPPEQVVAAAGRLLSEQLSGRSLREATAAAPGAVDLVDTPVTRCAARLSRAGRELLRGADAGEIQFDGVASVLGAPEFQEPAPLRALLRFLESPEAMRDTLAQLGARTADGFGVWIGQENPVDALQCFTVMTRRVALDGRVGMVAVLGPRRMPYLRALHGLDSLRRELGAAAGSPLN
jgi:heat-inducible transcriptional repressor